MYRDAEVVVSELQVLTQPLGGSPLARDAVDERVPADWYRTRPRTADEWRTYVQSVRDAFGAIDWRGALAPALAASGAAAERLARSADGAGIVITTGQQPGLFGGPIYTWSKALSALALADELEAMTGIPVAPVFWAATDDTDFAEASVTHVAVPGGVETLTLPAPTVEGASMRATPLGDVSTLLEELRLGAGSAASTEVLELARASYSREQTVGSAYLRLLRALLEPLGIAVLDAAHPAVRGVSLPIVLRALQHGESIDAAVRTRSAELQDAGYTPQVAHVPGLTVVHETVRGTRRRVPLTAARALTTSAHGELGPNVLLRPVVERSILPTAAYVAGPGELAYFAQVSAVAEAIGAPTPLVVPRWSGLILEPHIERILQRRALAIDELRDPHAAETRLARAQLPAALRSVLEHWRANVDHSMRDLRRAVDDGGGASEPLLSSRVVEGVERDMMRRLDRLERRAVASIKRRDHDLLRDIATARGALWPLGKPQERMLNLLPMLARHGMRVLDLMLAQAREHGASLISGASTSAMAIPDPAHDRR
ncbi:MAG TPA: bacillithiol biosynthesis BshC [Gemmatimonadaceae bacterium]|nr:bacillithiol biosynthesis BshC [Gemmatimonadaceae bacterium]